MQEWLSSYQPEICFNASDDGRSVIDEHVTRILPTKPELLLGQVRDAWPEWQPLDVGDWKSMATKLGSNVSPMKATGNFLADIMKRNPKRFRMFSPDELRSNKLDAVLDITTRNLQWDPETANKGGRVIEMLSEHTLQGFVQGYALTGRYSVFPSYEAFLAIVDTMIIQYAKFVKVARETKWRPDLPSLTYIETSTLVRGQRLLLRCPELTIYL